LCPAGGSYQGPGDRSAKWQLWGQRSQGKVLRQLFPGEDRIPDRWRGSARCRFGQVGTASWRGYREGRSGQV